MKCTVKIHTAFVVQDKEKINKTIERIAKIISGSYARPTNTANT